MIQASDAAAAGQLAQARLPAWCLPGDWPRLAGEVAPARVAWRDGLMEEIAPLAGPITGPCPLVLPAMVQAHAHLDKVFTAHRAPARGRGLLAAIEAVIDDRRHWTADDLRTRMAQGLEAAWEAGVAVLRTHVDWAGDQPPLAWDLLHELAPAWHGRVRLETVALVPLRFFAARSTALEIATRVAASGEGSVLGGFIHTSNWDPQALEHLLQAALAKDLDLDLHIDEELDPQAQGLATVVRLAHDMRFEGVIACSHACALAAQPLEKALATLDAMARLPGLRLVSLPATNLLLQDARPGATPRQRGIALVHEARARGIPVLIGSDNVQDPFCRGGSLDPLEAFWLGVHAAQLDDPFDAWTDTICRPDWLWRKIRPATLASGAVADLVCFEPQATGAWPRMSAGRRILRHGEWLATREAPRWTA